jgi:hypothetical protein
MPSVTPKPTRKISMSSKAVVPPPTSVTPEPPRARDAGFLPTLVRSPVAHAQDELVPAYSFLVRPATRERGAAAVALRCLARMKTGVSSLTASENVRVIEDTGYQRPRGQQLGTYLTESFDVEKQDHARTPKRRDLQPISPLLPMGKYVPPPALAVPTALDSSDKPRKTLGPPRCADVMTMSLSRASRGSPSPMKRLATQSGAMEDQKLRLVPSQADPAQVEAVTGFLAAGRRATGGYVAHRLERLHADETVQETFMSFVTDKIREDRLEVLRDVDRNHVARNATRVALSPVQRQHASEAASTKREQRQHDAKEKHAQIVDDFVAAAARDEEVRRGARRAKIQLAWLPLMIFAARTQAAVAAVQGRRDAVATARRLKAVTALQRRVRIWLSGRPKVTLIRALLIRVRFLRRVLTRVRVRLRYLYATRVTSVLRKVHRDHRTLPLFFAMKFFMVRVLRCQRHFRRNMARRRASRRLRVVQWDRAVAGVVDDLRLAVKRGRLEGAPTGLVQDGERAAREMAALVNLPASTRDAFIDEWFTDYLAKYALQLAHYQHARKVFNQQNYSRPVGGAGRGPVSDISSDSEATLMTAVREGPCSSSSFPPRHCRCSCDKQREPSRLVRE